MPLARFVFWFKDACVPAWHMVPFEPGRPVDLWRLRWLRTTAPDPPGFENLLYETFNVHSSEWETKTATERLLIDSEAPVVLIRAWNVFYCPMLGFELAGIYRALGYPSLRPDHFKCYIDSYLRVVIWTTSERSPVVYWTPFLNAEREVNLSSRPALAFVTLKGHQELAVWMPNEAQWEPIAVTSSLKIGGNLKTLLVKLPEVSITVGIGDELMNLERGFDGLPSISSSYADVKWRDYTAIAASIAPIYDVAVSSAMLERQTRSILRQVSTIGYIDSLYYAKRDVVVVSGKRAVDGVDLGHVVKRRKLS
ncbi:hypothetical protein LXA43DRAFT_1099496 [Ganoderma leucocontextum]|nr:hypothetical protein LXA43DRAFT_1099496 [Ganoderma leucocontextum]